LLAFIGLCGVLGLFAAMAGRERWRYLGLILSSSGR
jgi:hypothetical protein